MLQVTMAMKGNGMQEADRVSVHESSLVAGSCNSSTVWLSLGLTWDLESWL